MSASNPLPPTWRFDPADYAGLPVAFYKFLANLNLFTLAVYNLLNGGIGYANLQQALYTFTVTAGNITSVSFVNPLPIAPSAIVVGKILQLSTTAQALTTAASAANFVYNGTTINILNITGLVSGVTYQITVIVS